MKFFALAAALSAVPAALGAAFSVSFDPVYDNAGQSLATVACSDGSNGMLTKGFTNFSSLPTFPAIGGAPQIGGFNSDFCGTCWNITFNGTSLTMTAIDTGGPGFNIALSAMNKLTNGQAEQLGRVNADVTQLNASACGL